MRPGTAVAATFRPAYADALKDRSLIPPVSVTSQALKLVDAERAVSAALDAELEVVAPVLVPTATRATAARVVTANTARMPLRRLVVGLIFLKPLSWTTQFVTLVANAGWRRATT